MWEVIFVDIGGIVSWSEMWFWLILVELLTITQWVGERWFLLILLELLTIIQWVEVRGDFCWYWWNCWHHSMSWYERWFLLILVELLTITQWVKVRGDFCWYWWNCWPSLSWRWEVMFADGGIVDHHPMSWGERWFLLILVELLTITQWLRWEVIFVDIGGIVDVTQWVEVRGDFCWYWWNCWPLF